MIRENWDENFRQTEHLVGTALSRKSFDGLRAGVEDFLARRTRCLLLDAAESIAIAPRVAVIMAEELGQDESWVESQVAAYTELARGYLIQA